MPFLLYTTVVAVFCVYTRLLASPLALASSSLTSQFQLYGPTAAPGEGQERMRARMGHASSEQGHDIGANATVPAHVIETNNILDILTVGAKPDNWQRCI